MGISKRRTDHGSHTSHTGIGTCGNCHTGAVSGNSGGSAHIDGNIDVIGGYPANVTKPTRPAVDTLPAPLPPAM